MFSFTHGSARLDVIRPHPTHPYPSHINTYHIPTIYNVLLHRTSKPFLPVVMLSPNVQHHRDQDSTKTHVNGKKREVRPVPAISP